MINIILPMAGNSKNFDSKLFPYPPPLIEVSGKLMIERVFDNLSMISNECRFIFIVRSEDCRKFHLDSTLSLISPDNSVIVKLEGETSGALCSSLMAIKHISNDEPLIIANSDQIFSGSLAETINKISDSGADAGCVCFDSVHPRWSYVQINDGVVIQAAEKKPISRHAIAGLYYFRTGNLFVNSAMNVVMKDGHIDGNFFLSPVFNEIILNGGKVVPSFVENSEYHSFYTMQRLEEYISSL